MRKKTGNALKPLGAFVEKVAVFVIDLTLARCAGVAARIFVRLAYRLEVIGWEDIPKTGGVVLVGNHSSHLDGPSLITAVKRPAVDFSFLVARDYFFRVRLLRPVCKYILHFIPLGRRGSSAKEGLATANHNLAQGMVVVIFPEGTRSLTGEIGKFDRGFASIACKSGRPIVPFAIAGTFDLWPRWQRWPKLSGRIKVFFDRPITAEEYRHLTPEELAEMLQRRVTALHQSMTSLVEPSRLASRR